MKFAKGAVTLSAVACIAISSHAVAQSGPEPRWKGTVDLTIGGSDTDDDASFGRIGGIAVDKTGRIFIGDAQDNQIKLFTPGGAFVKRIGRSGSGPLEFKKLGTIVIGPNQLLWARDEGNARMMSIDVSAAAPREVKTVPLVSFTGGTRLPITFQPDGSIVDETIWFNSKAGTFRPLRVRRTTTGSIARTDTLLEPEGANAGIHKVTAEQKNSDGKVVGMSEMYVWQPYGPRWIRAYGPGGLRADVVSAKYEVRILDGNEKLIRTITRVVKPVALSSREKQKADSTLDAHKGRLPFGVPSNKAPIVGVVFTQDGGLWVERAVGDGRPREADVFDQSGRFVAAVEWPSEIDLFSGYPVIIGKSVTVATTGSNDLPRVVRLTFR